MKYRIAAMLASETVELVCWHRVVKLHLPVFGRHQSVGGCCEIVELLSAPAHDSFQPIKGMTPVPGQDFSHLLNPLEVMLKLTEPTAKVVYIVLQAQGGNCGLFEASCTSETGFSLNVPAHSAALSPTVSTI